MQVLGNFWKCYIFSEKMKITKNVPVQVFFTGKIFYREKSMNSIVRVGDGDGLYGEQWNLSGDRRVSIVLMDQNPRPQAVLFHRLIPSVFHQTLSKYTPNNSFKMRYFYMSRAKSVHFLILYTTLVYTSTLKSTV